MNNITNLKASISAILKNNNLNELSLGDTDELSDPTYVIWWDNSGTPNEDPVIKVTSDKDSLSFEVDARDFGNTVTVWDCDIDRLEWWQGIRENMLEVLRRDGKHPCPVCGKPLRARQKYCSEKCRKLVTPAPTAQDIARAANKRIRQLIGKIIEYEPLVHAGECPDNRNSRSKDCTGISCEQCRKRYYTKMKKQLIEKYTIIP